jgi:hypothetical protein
VPIPSARPASLSGGASLYGPTYAGVVSGNVLGSGSAPTTPGRNSVYSGANSGPSTPSRFQQGIASAIASLGLLPAAVGSGANGPAGGAAKSRELQALEKENEHLRQVMATMRDLEKSQKTAQEALKGELQQRSEALGLVMHDANRLKEQKVASEARLAAAEDELRAIQNQYHASAAEAERVLSGLRAEVSHLQAQLQQAAQAMEQAQGHNQAVSAELALVRAQATQQIGDGMRRCQELESAVASLEQSLAVSQRERAEGEARHRDELVSLEQRLLGQVDKSKADVLAEGEAARTALLVEHQAQVEALQRRCALKEAQCDALKHHTMQLEAAAAERLGAAYASISAFKHELLSVRNEQKAMIDTTLSQFGVAAAQLVEKVNTAEREAHAANSRYVKEVAERRRLYDRLQEARGNIRVFARIRPMLNKEVELNETVAADASGSYEVFLPAATEIGTKYPTAHTFEFDRVFGARSSQDEVFEEVRPMITSALDGFHACIFAYGQTGSGKTWTMEGSPQNRGVYSRSLNDLFAMMHERRAEFEYGVKVTMVEIYNENVIDLLAETPASSFYGADGETVVRSLQIKTGPTGNFIDGVSTVDVASPADVEAVMTRGAMSRSVGRTNANEHSSRSHSVLMIDLPGINRLSGERTMGRLVLVDLAGSERIAKSGAEGQRLKEAQNINSSLTSLGSVMHALTQKASHIPFRDSKLTWLLADSLGGHNKVTMFVNISPVMSSRSETINSLNFASRARKVELGKANKKADSEQIVTKLKSELKIAQDEIKRIIADTQGLNERVSQSSMKEAMALSQVAEWQSRYAEVERAYSSLAGGAVGEFEALSKVASSAKAETERRDKEIEELQLQIRELKFANQKAAAAGAAQAVKEVDSLAAMRSQMETAMKRAIDEAVLKTRAEAKKMVADAESATRVEAEKTISALRKQMKDAETKSKNDLAAAVAAARLQWERDLEREQRKAAVVAAKTSRKTSLLPMSGRDRSSLLPVAANAAQAPVMPVAMSSMAVVSEEGETEEVAPSVTESVAPSVETSLIEMDEEMEMADAAPVVVEEEAAPAVAVTPPRTTGLVIGERCDESAPTPECTPKQTDAHVVPSISAIANSCSMEEDDDMAPTDSEDAPLEKSCVSFAGAVTVEYELSGADTPDGAEHHEMMPVACHKTTPYKIAQIMAAAEADAEEEARNVQAVLFGSDSQQSLQEDKAFDDIILGDIAQDEPAVVTSPVAAEDDSMMTTEEMDMLAPDAPMVSEAAVHVPDTLSTAVTKSSRDLGKTAAPTPKPTRRAPGSASVIDAPMARKMTEAASPAAEQAFSYGSRERARALGMPTPKPSRSILKKDDVAPSASTVRAGSIAAVSASRSLSAPRTIAAGELKGVSLLSPSSNTITRPGMERVRAAAAAAVSTSASAPASAANSRASSRASSISGRTAAAKDMGAAMDMMADDNTLLAGAAAAPAVLRAAPASGVLRASNAPLGVARGLGLKGASGASAAAMPFPLSGATRVKTTAMGPTRPVASALRAGAVRVSAVETGSRSASSSLSRK